MSTRSEEGSVFLVRARRSCLDRTMRPRKAEPFIDKDPWREIARMAFPSGKCSEQDEVDAHEDLTGATVKDSYLFTRGACEVGQ